MKMKKTSSVAALVSAALALTGLASQNANAAAATTKHKHHHHKASSQITPSVRTIERAEDARLARMDAEIADLRAQLSNQKHESTQVAAKQQQLETQVAEEAAKESAKNNLVFFRGGYASLTSNRDNELLTSGTNTPLGAYSPTGGNGNGWYVGAGMDFRASDDFFGLSDMVALDAELMFSYSNFGQSTNALVSALTGTTVRNQITMFTLAASPKVKFNLADGDFRPWIIPFGLAINVVSPPSSGVTVLNPGLMLGTGMEYRIWENLWVGTDFRYQFTGGDLNYKTNYGNGTVLNQTPTQGLQAGAYVGVGF